MSYTAKELDDFVEGGNITQDYTNYKGEPRQATIGWPEIKWQDFEGDTLETPFGALAFVEDFGGMDQGSEYWVVVSVTNDEGTRYFQKTGWYASHDGGYLDGTLTEVVSEQKVVTVWGNYKPV